jgi:hypothetical protein
MFWIVKAILKLADFINWAPISLQTFRTNFDHVSFVAVHKCDGDGFSQRSPSSAQRIHSGGAIHRICGLVHDILTAKSVDAPTESRCLVLSVGFAVPGI